MESEKYLEGQSMQRPPLFESDGFMYWINRFETYVKSKDLDLWHVITDGDFPPIQNNPETKKDEVVPFHKQNDDLMVIYNSLPRNNQVKANKIDLLVQQYEQFIISEEESIDNVFTKFNTIITSLKALDEGFSRKNCVRKFLRALHRKWRSKVMESSDEDSSTSDNEDEGRFVKQPYEERRSFQRNKDDKNKTSERKCFKCGDPNHLIGECPKQLKYQNQRAFVGGAWSDSDNDEEEKTKDKKCLMAKDSNE
ncbi:zf-CCHC domain-containing protein, partial [Tanacetum coccineum]